MADKKKLSRRAFLVRGGLSTVGVLAVGTYLFRNPIRRGIAGMVNTATVPYQGNTDIRCGCHFANWRLPCVL